MSPPCFWPPWRSPFSRLTFVGSCLHDFWSEKPLIDHFSIMLLRYCCKKIFWCSISLEETWYIHICLDQFCLRAARYWWLKLFPKGYSWLWLCDLITLQLWQTANIRFLLWSCLAANEHWSMHKVTFLWSVMSHSTYWQDLLILRVADCVACNKSVTLLVVCCSMLVVMHCFPLLLIFWWIWGAHRCIYVCSSYMTCWSPRP